MKKALALLLSFAMLFTVLTVNVFAATTTPTVTVKSATVKAGEETSITVELTDFSEVAGMDITISTENDVTFSKVVDDKNMLNENNTVVKDKEIHIVELVTLGTESITLTITAIVNEDATIKVEGDLAENGTTLFTTDAYVDGSITITKLSTSGDDLTGVTEVEANEGYFMPYGALHTTDENDKIIYPIKDTNGVFAVDSTKTYTYTQYPIPTNGIMTFGVSDTKVEEAAAVQFGTYCDATSDSRGTMIIAGDVNELKAKLGIDGAELAKKINTIHDTYNPNGAYANVKMNFTYNSEKYTVRVYKVEQTKYYWANNEDASQATVIEYAVRAYNVDTANEDYVAIGYFEKDDAVTFADDFKAY